MNLEKEIRIEFTNEEKDILFKADEIITDVFYAIAHIKKNGGKITYDILPEFFWSIYHDIIFVEGEVEQ